ncbi:UDP-N-acetylmuramate dehydrogenase [Xanthomonadaceae bacterium JHOS43]|nr:UDP-N-acetylmuramate dehydrogenase [Xanthomonadaceae bacterium JHOS43]MCX7563991.1 UDP-N-acetylmuramate dehydrogenase [Xanthomonadaceae bacterium XH05]
MSAAYTLTENASLLARNGFRVPARSELLVDVRRPDGLDELFSLPWMRTAPVLVLGEGSNTLIVGDVPGATICVGALERRIVSDDGESVLVRVGAGEHWDDVVRWSLGLGLAGLENLALIPGTAGAAPIQNIGAYGTEVGEFIETVEAFDRQVLRNVRLTAAECAFGYRDSLFKRDPSRWLVTAIELRLPRHRAPRIDYPGLRDELAVLGAGDSPRPAHVAEAVTRLRTRKLPNPTLLPNVGSFFRNPIIPATLAEELLRDEAGLPVFPAGDESLRKLPAAWLIERAGWKGHRDGDAGVAAQHALVLVNHGTASGTQMLDLARRIAASVRERFGVTLEPEARIIGATF